MLALAGYLWIKKKKKERKSNRREKMLILRFLSLVMDLSKEKTPVIEAESLLYITCQDKHHWKCHFE